MKKILAFGMTIVLLLGLLSGCILREVPRTGWGETEETGQTFDSAETEDVTETEPVSETEEVLTVEE